MQIHRVALVALIVGLASLIVYRLLEARRELRAPPAGGEAFSLFAGALGASPASELAAMKAGAAAGVKPLGASSLPLREFCVKAAFNAACSGAHVSTDAIAYVLSRGCRFLDFEVFEVDGALRVGVCDTPLKSAQNITSSSTVSLNDALTQVAAAGFAAPSPNAGDPLFVRLRLRPQPGAGDLVSPYRLAAMDIQNTIGARLFQGAVDGATPIAQLMGKAVVVWDKTSAPGLEAVPALAAQVNMLCGSDAMRAYSYERLLDQYSTPPSVNSDGTSDVARLTLAEPDPAASGGANPQIRPFVRDHGVQILAVRFYLRNAALDAYESFFRDCGGGLVPFRAAIPYTAEA